MSNLVAFKDSTGLPLVNFVRSLGINASVMDSRIEQLSHRLYDLEDEGYDFTEADGNAALLALDTYDYSDHMIVLKKYSALTKPDPKSDDVNDSLSDAWLTLQIGAQLLTHVHDSRSGPVDAFKLTFNKTLKDAHPDFIPLDIEKFNAPAVGEGSDARVRVQAAFSFVNGEKHTRHFQHISNNVVLGAIQTMVLAYSLALYEQRRMGLIGQKQALIA